MGIHLQKILATGIHLRKMLATGIRPSLNVSDGYSPSKNVSDGHRPSKNVGDGYSPSKNVSDWHLPSQNVSDAVSSIAIAAKPSVEYGTEQYNFGQYPKDYFDFIIIDECHRGGANDEGNWRGILEYFSPAVQLGLTATPKRKDNVDTYKYFGEPVYVYSLKEGINDGFLTPFKVKRIKTTLDDYLYTGDDQIIEGEIEKGKLYTESDFNKIIEIKAREAKRVQLYMDDANQKEKAIIFFLCYARPRCRSS